MANVLAQVVLQGNSQLPEDRFVNTFWFSDGSPYGDHSAAVISAVGAFYETPNTNTLTVGSFIDGFVSRTYTIKTYNMADPKPRVPVATTRTLPAEPAGTTHILPPEVACTMSFYAAPPRTPSRRGRIYVGPLNNQAMVVGGTATPTTFGGGFRTTLTQAAARLLAAGIGWSVHSAKNGTYAPVTGGFVDDAVDIQRRRGRAASARTTWGS